MNQRILITGSIALGVGAMLAIAVPLTSRSTSQRRRRSRA